jgi:hypothetical protein
LEREKGGFSSIQMRQMDFYHLEFYDMALEECIAMYYGFYYFTVNNFYY